MTQYCFSHYLQPGSEKAKAVERNIFRDQSQRGSWQGVGHTVQQNMWAGAELGRQSQAHHTLLLRCSSRHLVLRLFWTPHMDKTSLGHLSPGQYIFWLPSAVAQWDPTPAYTFNKTLHSYCELDVASDWDATRSVRGYCFTLSLGAMSWINKKQPLVQRNLSTKPHVSHHDSCEAIKSYEFKGIWKHHDTCWIQVDMGTSWYMMNSRGYGSSIRAATYDVALQ